MTRLLTALVFGLILLPASAFALPVTFFKATLSGPGESPPTTSPGTGTASVIYDTHMLEVDVTFSGLEAGTTASHVHCCVTHPGAAGVATTVPTFPGFPLGVTSAPICTPST